MVEESDYPLVVGALIAFLGVIAAISPFIAGLALSISLGIILIFGAIIQTANVFASNSWRSGIVQSILALIYLLGGLSLVTRPVSGLATLTVLLFIYLVFQGAAEIIWGLQLRDTEHGFGIVLSGLLSLLLAGLIWLQWPTSAGWAIGLLFGISLISTGLSMIFYSRKMKE